MITDRPVILIIDDDEVCLTFGKEILENRYTVYPVLSGEQAFAILEKITPDVILLDIEMPGMDGYAVLSSLKQKPETKDIPVMFLTSYKDPGNELDGLNLGAADYITKPFSPILLVQRIENQLLLHSRRKELVSFNENLQKLTDEQAEKIDVLEKALLNILSDNIENRDIYLRKTVEIIQKQALYKGPSTVFSPELFEIFKNSF